MKRQYIDTFAEISTAIACNKSKHPLDTINNHKRVALIDAFNESTSKKEFVSKIKISTGMTYAGIKRCKACQYLLNEI